MTAEKSSKPSLFIRIARHARGRLVAGLLVVVPLWLTYVALNFFFKKLDSIFAPVVDKWLGISFPGLGFIFLFAFLYLIGVIATNIVGRSLINFGESIVNRIPLVKNLYQATKQLLQSISFSRGMGFKKVVFIEYPRAGLKALAFVTNTIVDEREKDQRYLTVFIPTTPNPTSGVFELVPESQAMPANMTIEEGIKMVISGGLMIPQTFRPVTKESKEIS
jgi:uncharacterized membrane protein